MQSCLTYFLFIFLCGCSTWADSLDCWFIVMCGLAKIGLKVIIKGDIVRICNWFHKYIVQVVGCTFCFGFLQISGNCQIRDVMHRTRVFSAKLRLMLILFTAFKQNNIPLLPETICIKTSLKQLKNTTNVCYQVFCFC